MKEKYLNNGKQLLSADFETAIELTGYGKFHFWTIFVCSICILVLGFQNGIASYILPSAQIELNISSLEVGFINVAFLTGGILSCFLWGILADIKGRRDVLIYTSFTNALLTIATALIPSTASLVACRFFNGFFIGAPGSIIFSYFAEFQPKKYRAISVCYCGVVFTISWLLLPAFAYLLLPLPINVQLNNILSITPWRVFLIIIALPEIIVGLGFVQMPESPKFLAAKGRSQEALDILRRMYVTNTGNNVTEFPVKTLLCDQEKAPAETLQCRRRYVRVFGNLFDDIKSLFRVPLLKISLLTCSIMFANMFGMFGLGLWLPDLFIRFDKYQKLYPNSTISVTHLSKMNTFKTTSDNSALFDATVMKNTIIMALSSLVYNAVFCWVSTKLKPKTITMFSMILGGIAATSIYWMTTPFGNLLVACIFQATMITANMTIAGIGVELFPTKVSGLAICCIMCAGRLGAALSNIVFGYFIDNYCEVPIFAVGSIVLLGGLLCAIVPNNSEKCHQPIKSEIQIYSKK